MFVTLRYYDQIGRNNTNIISQLISLVFSACSLGTTTSRIYSLLQIREHPEILAEMGIRQITRGTYL